MDLEQQLEKLCFVVHVTKYKENLWIPGKFVYNVNLAHGLNDGVGHNNNRLIFYSSDKTKQPNFLLPIATTLNTDQDACHMAKIVKAYGNFLSRKFN